MRNEWVVRSGIITHSRYVYNVWGWWWWEWKEHSYMKTLKRIERCRVCWWAEEAVKMFSE